MASNFDFLARYWPDMAQMGKLAELYLYSDPIACMNKIGMLARRTAQEICAFEGLILSNRADYADQIRALQYADVLPKRIDDIFYALRKAGSGAPDSAGRASTLLRLVFHLCGWFMQVYGDWSFQIPAYEMPKDNMADPQQLQAQENKLREWINSAQNIQTAASSANKNDRAKKAEEAARNLVLTPEEMDCIGKDPVRMDVEVLPVVNYALQQNGAAVIRSITLANHTDTAMENVDLQITSTPEFTLPFTRHIDCLPANQTLELSRPKLILNGAFLGGMTEKVTGVLNIRLCRGDSIIVSDNAEITVLAFDEWHGLAFYPELLAAFVTPNHPEIARIIARATEFLGQWTGDTSMDAYQSQDPNRVVSQAAAIFTAIKEQAIAYAVAPASFEQVGQRVRLCDMVLQQKLGTCLDLTLLYASCLEAVGLHPLLITTAGHIFTGVWLEERMFPEPVQDDVSLITKRLASGVNEIAVVETTSVTSGRNHSFDDARAIGERNLTAQRVECIIDIRRARLSGISPLPQRVHTSSGWTIEHNAAFQADTMSAPRALEKTIQIDPNAKEDSIPKKVQWERKLLDLGLRNTLINLRLTKTQLPILTDSLDALEDALADGSDFTILPRPGDLEASAISFEAMQELGTTGLIQAEFQNKRLRSVYSETELTKTIKGLYRTAKTALEENGANTLYLALGILKWFENKRSTRARYAPVILLPIEMVRKSAAQGYVIRLRDDEPQMNITMLEKLKQDFGVVVKGVDPLPADEHGIDIRKVLTVLRKAVMEQPHWDVLEAATIGIFSFSQFVMWNDIRNRTEDLMRNKIVRSLIEGRLTWDAKPLDIGQRVEETDVLLPMPADASQLYAIQAACAGESFVLHGPPGTGKSQTITSLIANALAKGKSVLFVAEKMAALEVVQKRLDAIGIGPFCLELHSNKSRKKDVLEQLRQATEVTKTTSAEQFAAKAKQLAALRAELDDYARQLHKSLPCGKTLYELINQYETCLDAPDIAPFDRAYLRSLDGSAMERNTLTVERLIAAGRQIGHPYNHPLAPVTCTQYTQKLRGSLGATVENYRAQLQSIAPFAEQLTEALGEKPIALFADLQRLAGIASQMACWYDMPRDWVKAEFPEMYFEEVAGMAQHFLKADALEQQLLQNFSPDFLAQNGEQLFSNFVQTSAKWFLPKMLGLNKLAGQVNVFAKKPVDKDSLKGSIVALRDYQQESGLAAALLETYGKDLGGFYHGKTTDWKRIAQLASAAWNSAQALYNVYGTYDFLHAHCGEPELREAVFALQSGFAAFGEAKKAFDDLLGIAPKAEENWLVGQSALCDAILSHADGLKEWITFQGIAKEAEESGLGNVVDNYRKGANHDTVLPSYEKALLFGLICDAIDESGTLNTFSGTVFNEKIQQYKRADREWTDLSRQEAYCRLASKVPNFTSEAAHSSELGILQRCIKSGGRGTSIRKLFDQIPNLLPRLCPCMLMSPISAAQYLDPKREPFDIVVFDEASQLPTSKAVGVLARGKNAVIVGDPKQMPPTSFFAVNAVDEDNPDVEDLESILDDCLALNMPQAYLLWHYRSRHESLIAFSNRQFYENKLFTFPSVNDRESKVRLVHVDGVFERGKARVNRAEAQAVVEELQRRRHDPRKSGQSVGVVTFNISQQNLIDDLLNEACAKDQTLEQWAFGSEEPVFIKNLENVQGDERDVILFSIGYGPDETGKVSMNFGPLNRDGGWRRLNVAVSRARCEMVVFSTLRPDQIDLSRTKAEGVAALRAFLEYAEGRALALDENTVQKYRHAQDGIAASICKALGEKGYDTQLSVGHSEFRIDVGVVDPKDPERYLLGILLDGPSYGGAKTTRDREIAQVSILGGLGWNILRVWSMDWWDNRDKELKRIFAALEELQNRAQEPQIQEAPAAAPTAKLQGNAAAPAPKAEPAAQIIAAPVYKAAILPVRFISAEDFTQPWFERDIQSKMQTVIDAEAPVSTGMLTKRVIQSYGIARAGSRIQGHLNTLLGQMRVKTTTQGDMVICWRQDQDPDAYLGFRVSGDGENRRDVRDVPVQEVANAVCAVLYEQVSMLEEDLLRETAKKLGYTRLGGNVLAALASGIAYAKGGGEITLGTNGAYVLSDSGMSRAENSQNAFEG